MNRLFKSIILTYIIIISSTYSLAQNDHLGKWKGIDQGEIGYLHLNPKGYASFVVENDTIGGESFVIDDIEVCMKYEVNYKTSINTINLTICLKSDDSEIGTLPGIFKFDHDGNMILCLNFDDETRPKSFIEEDTIKLVKQRH